MRKSYLPLLGAAVLFAACQKTERIAAPEETLTEEEVTSGVSRQCASNEVLEEQLKADPQRAAALEELERKTAVFTGRSNSQFRSAGVLYVPVVINVVLPNAAQVSDAQIQTQLAVLNADFNRTNAELQNSNVYLANYPFANVANCQVEFYVQNSATDVRRKNATVAAFGTNDAVKRTSQGGLDPLNASSKMNVWVCDLSNGLLGYAQFPGGSAATDGIVIDYQAFGTAASYSLYSQFNKGRTATHEVGHWFNLRHIWGDARCGNDLVGDTPAHDASNGGCPASGLRSKCSGRPLEQWMNYMDYTNDACMYMFTAGQKTRVDAAIDGPRAAYVRTTKS